MFDNVPYRATGAHITSFLAKAGIAAPKSFKMVSTRSVVNHALLTSQIPNKEDKRYSGTWLVECADRAAYEATILHTQIEHKIMDRTVH